MALGVRGRVMILIAIALLPGVLAATYLHLENRAAQIERTEQTVAQVIEVRLLRQQSHIETTHQVLLMLAAVDSVRNRFPGACDNFVTAMREASPVYADLGAVEPDGRVSCSATPTPAAHGEQRHFLIATQTGRLAMGEYALDPATGRPYLDFALPLVDDTDNVTAVLYARLDLTWIYREAAPLTASPGTVLGVVNDTGLILVRQPNPERYIGTRADDLDTIHDTILNERRGLAIAAGIDGIERQYAFAPLPGDPGASSAYIYYGIPLAAVTAPAEREFRTGIILTLIGAALVFALALLVSETYLTRRIKAMTHTAHRLAAGDLTARTGLPGGEGDLERLAATLDHLADAFQRLDQAKLDLINNTAHQLRTPLTTINVSVYNLEKEVGPALGEKGTRALLSIRRNTERLTRTIDAVLAVARFQSGELILASTPLDLARLARKRVEETAPRAEAAGIDMRLDAAGPVHVDGDAEWLERAVQDLLDNALRATPREGTIRVRVEKHDDGAVLSVTDSGHGFDPSHAQELFQPFGHLPETLQHTEAGIGLGLYLVRAIIERQGGHVEAHSEGVGTGARFTFTIPRADG